MCKEDTKKENIKYELAVYLIDDEEATIGPDSHIIKRKTFANAEERKKYIDDEFSDGRLQFYDTYCSAFPVIFNEIFPCNLIMQFSVVCIHCRSVPFIIITWETT